MGSVVQGTTASVVDGTTSGFVVQGQLAAQRLSTTSSRSEDAPPAGRGKEDLSQVLGRVQVLQQLEVLNPGVTGKILQALEKSFDQTSSCSRTDGRDDHTPAADSLPPTGSRFSAGTLTPTAPLLVENSGAPPPLPTPPSFNNMNAEIFRTCGDEEGGGGGGASPASVRFGEGLAESESARRASGMASGGEIQTDASPGSSSNPVARGILKNLAAPNGEDGEERKSVRISMTGFEGPFLAGAEVSRREVPLRVPLLPQLHHSPGDDHSSVSTPVFPYAAVSAQRSSAAYGGGNVGEASRTNLFRTASGTSEITPSLSRAGSQLSKTRSSGSLPKNHSLMHVRQAITSDIETKTELYQTIFDSAFAAYSQMYELGMISELAYRALLESFEFAQEAVHGELAGQYPFLTNFPELHKQPHRVQTEASLEVFFDSLMYFLEHGIGLRWKLGNYTAKYLWRWFPCVSEEAQIAFRWTAMRRSFETVFSFIIVNETLIEELPLFDDFPGIRGVLVHLLEQAVGEELYGLHCESPEM